MLSRVADSLYWTSRYFERADSCARVLGATWQLMLNPSHTRSDDCWRAALLRLGLTEESAMADLQEGISQLALDKSNAASIVSCIASARENASQVREEISSEMWEHLNRLYHDLIEASMSSGNGARAIAVVAIVREGSWKFSGVTDGTMNHDEGYQFMELGKYSERSAGLCDLLNAYYSCSAKATKLDWIGLLSSCSAFESYCKVYSPEVHPIQVAEFLLLHREFPHSIRHAAERIGAALRALMNCSPARNAARAERIAGKLRASLQYASIAEVMDAGLHEYLNGIAAQSRDLHSALHEAYIDYSVEEALKD